MIVACHQPLYLPWPGLFYKAASSDLLVLLDHVAFPRGRSWVSRNRLKNADGSFWLTVPVKRKGQQNTPINTIEIYNELEWERKHFESIRQAYSHAPFLEDHIEFFADLYKQRRQKLIDLNLAIFNYLMRSLHIETDVVLSSTLKGVGRGAELPVSICQLFGAKSYLTFAAAEKYLDLTLFGNASIRIKKFTLHPPVYPQLWGEFVPNLSTLDMLLCCGPKSIRFILKSGRIEL